MVEPHNLHGMVKPAFADASIFVERTLDALIPKPTGAQSRLFDAMRRQALNGADRFRAFLVLQSGRLFGVDRGALGRTAAAVECVQACFCTQQSQADADLARDALFAFAFNLVAAQEAHGDPFVRCELVSKLSQAMGHGGLAGGRAVARSLEGTIPTMHEVTRLERMKTAVLIVFSCEAGAILGKASPAARMALSNYGQELGLAFQIAEDLNANPDIVGASPSAARILGPERARAQARALASQAAQHLDLFDEKADLLRAAAEFVVARF